MAFDSSISGSSFGMFNNEARHLEHSVLVVKDCKPSFFGGVFSTDVLLVGTNLVTSGDWLCNLEPYLTRVFEGVPFLCCSFSAIFKF